MVLPQFTGAYGALKYGVDWKGQPLRHKDGSPYSAAETWLYGLQQLGEAMIPVASRPRTSPSKHPLKTVQHELRVLSSTRVKPKTKVKVKTGDGFGGPSEDQGRRLRPREELQEGGRLWLTRTSSARSRRRSASSTPARVRRRRCSRPASPRASLRNLNYGDRDSKGSLQQRALDGLHARPAALPRGAGLPAPGSAANTQGGLRGAACAAVQRSAFPGRYDQHR
jgi:hypothetical protein